MVFVNNKITNSECCIIRTNIQKYKVFVKKNIHILIIIFLVYTSSAKNLNGTLIQDAVNQIEISNISKHLHALGNDSMLGRAPGTKGGDIAAEYLSQQMKRMGLKTFGEIGGFQQNVPMHGSQPMPKTQMSIFIRGNEIELDFGKDYVLYEAGEDSYSPYPVEIVFVGYGIAAPEFDYNDYQQIDVEGKIVVMLEGEPYSEDQEFFSGKENTIYSCPYSKQRIAISRGACGSIIIPNLAENSLLHWDSKKTEFNFENVKLAYSASSNFSALFNPVSAQKLFSETNTSLIDIYQLHLKNKVFSFPLDTKIYFNAKISRRDFVSSNIIGFIEGSDPKLKDEYLVISAHYDHLGIGPAVKGDSIYNGVMDNAIGVAGTLEMARILKEMQHEIRRSIIILLAAGEEKGALGSAYYTDHSPVPLHKTIANVNIDGLAFIDSIKSVIGVGAKYSNLKEFLHRAAKKNNLFLTDIPGIFKRESAFSLSDQISFANAGIPSVLILEGPDFVNYSRDDAIEKMLEYSQTIYHTPFDDLRQPMDLKAAAQHLKTIMTLCLDLANNDDNPQWNSDSPYLNIRLRSIAEKR